MLPGEEIIHVLAQEYKIDGETNIKQPEGMYGSRLEASFHIVAGQTAAIKNITRCVVTSGLKINALNLEPLASADAVLSEEEKEAGVVLVDIGGGTTDVAIFKFAKVRWTSACLSWRATFFKRSFLSRVRSSSCSNDTIRIPNWVYLITFN